MTIVIGINSLVATNHVAYSNHIQLFFRLGHWAEKGGHKICLVNPSRCSIDRMRNMCAKTALEVNADYLLFIDDDVLVPTDFIEMLLEDNADIVAGDVIIRGYPFDHMAFIGDKTSLLPIKDLPAEIGKQGIGPVIAVNAIGFSLCLIKVQILRKMASPWFITGVNNTEDIYFCLKAKEFIPDISIKLDSRVQCGHILWSEVISRDNKEDYSRYMEAQNPHLVEAKETDGIDRGELYLTKMKELTGNAESS